MSLLNKALRKKLGEEKRSDKIRHSRREPKVFKKSKTKIYYIVLFVVFICTLGTLAALKLFYLPASVPIKPPTTVTNPVQQTVETHNLVQPAQKQVDQEKKIKKEMKLDVTASTGAKPENKKNVPLIAESKKVFKRDPIETQNVSLRKRQETDRREKNKIRIKNSTETVADEKNLNLFFQKALIYHRQNKLDKAIHMYEQVLQINPNHYDTLFNLASVYMKTSIFSKAYPLLKKLKGMDPENPLVLLNLALVEIGLGKPQSALAYLIMAEKRTNGSKFEIFFHRGVAFSHLDHLNEAIIWYKRAEEFHPHHSRLLFNIALVYDKMQNYPEAIRYYSKFLKQNLSSSNEKKEVEGRILALKGYMAGQSEKLFIQKHE